MSRYCCRYRWKIWFDVLIRTENKDKLMIENNYSGKTIVIVLESPHKDEFRQSNVNKSLLDKEILPNPAAGKTGENYYGEKNEEFRNSGRNKYYERGNIK